MNEKDTVEIKVEIPNEVYLHLNQLAFMAGNTTDYVASKLLKDATKLIEDFTKNFQFYD